MKRTDKLTGDRFDAVSRRADSHLRSQPSKEETEALRQQEEPGKPYDRDGWPKSPTEKR